MIPLECIEVLREDVIADVLEDKPRGPCAERCAVCGSLLHLEFGRLRCRSCNTGQGSTEEGGL